METFTLRKLSFWYPQQTEPALRDLNLSVRGGEFLTLCGPSGCGKSTLLRQLKSVLTPHGVRSGEILFEGRTLEEIDFREQSAAIGFVQQSPENQIVTDKVWHELAFGLESLGCDNRTIRSRVAEMASFFGIQTWFHKNVTELSGGQKQLLNLASIMTMQPSVLILDEPTSQLDPIAASDFLATIGRINRELGTTVIITEHRLEDVLPMSDRVLCMEKGSIIAEGSPAQLGEALKSSESPMFLAMPTPMRVWAAVENDAPCPITVRDGRDWLDRQAEKSALGKVPQEDVKENSGEKLIGFSEVWFKYEKDRHDVLKDLSFSVNRGEFVAVLGGNGTGKTTMLSVIAGLNKPYRGKLQVNGSTVLLPQNPQTLFVKKSVREDLAEMLKGRAVDKKESARRFDKVVSLCRLGELLDRHPYDLSGGEQQRVALAKVLLLEPEILLMDEPTKGLDAEFKQILAGIVRSLQRRGITVLMVSHDVEFCARYADRCALFFDGNVVTEGRPREFFSGNSFYTTAANRMARHLLPEAVTAGDIITACGGTLPDEPIIDDFGDDDDDAGAPIRHSTESKKPAPLPWWRKLIAIICGAAVLVAFAKTVGISDLSKLVNSDGLHVSLGEMKWFYIVSAGLIILAIALGRKSEAPVYPIQMPKEKRKLPKRTIAAAAMILLLIPLTIFIGVYYLGSRKYYFIALLILFETMLPFALVFEGRRPKARELVIIAVLCAIGVAGRGAFFMLPNFKPVMALVIISGVAFGGETGFMVGAMTMLVSNIFFGQGPWTPWQMFAMGIIGFLAGVLFRKGLLRRSLGSLCAFGAICAVLVYGGIMNPAAALMWAHTINKELLIAYYVTGFPVDLIHAVATVSFLILAAEPMLEKLERVKLKYGLVE
ncbi:MAG TPA: energy-coupling factor transporter ATPase [Bacillota bacterium]|nr:energy-coupling factor transporter ATPase [Bacillota bacterium]